MAQNPVAWNDTSPAAPAGKVNIKFQADAPNVDPSVPRNASAYMPPMTASVGGAVPTPPNDATKFLNGTGAWTTPAGGGGGGSSESAVEISAKDQGTSVFAGSNTSLAAWTTVAGSPSVDTTYNPFTGAYKIPANAIIKVDTGASPDLKNCAIDFDFLSTSNNSGTGSVLEFVFGATTGGAGPLVQLDLRSGSAGWASAAFTSWGTFGVSSTNFGLIFPGDIKWWHHLTLVIDSLGTSAKLFVDGVLITENITITLSGTFIGFQALLSEVQIKSVKVTLI